MNRLTVRLLTLLVLPASLALAQPYRVARPPTPYVPVPPSPAAQAALRLHQAGCLAEDYDDSTCDRAVQQLEAVVREDPRQLDAQLALSDALWNQAFRQPAGSDARTRLRQRALDRYQQMVDASVPDARPYYALSVLTRDAGTRVQLLRRTVELAPKHPEAHKDLAWLLLDENKPEEAAREYRLHLSVNPPQGREKALADLRFASRLNQQGLTREAAQVYDTVWDATGDEGRAERCHVFKTVDTEPYERIGARFAQRLRESRGACDNLEQLKKTQLLLDQGHEQEARQRLERQVASAPTVAEPYLALQGLYLRQGQEAKAAEVMNHYFQQERDAGERCLHFRTLTSQTVHALEPTLRQDLERACTPKP